MPIRCIPLYIYMEYHCGHCGYQYNINIAAFYYLVEISVVAVHYLGAYNVGVQSNISFENVSFLINSRRNLCCQLLHMTDYSGLF